ncbi:MAG: DUF6132 family protein [Bacteroidota bacterium]|nr:DUF6132 family protein [Bacteroidota bacterium]
MDNNCEIKEKPKNVKEFFTSWYFWKPFIAIIIGGVSGYLYFYFVGCKSGTCPITGSAWGSIITGGLFGFFIVSGPCGGNCK